MVPGDKSEEAISDTKSLNDEYDELVLSAASESDPLSSANNKLLTSKRTIYLYQEIFSFLIPI